MLDLFKSKGEKCFMSSRVSLGIFSSAIHNTESYLWIFSHKAQL